MDAQHKRSAGNESFLIATGLLRIEREGVDDEEAT
jgi:hypothetical protein